MTDFPWFPVGTQITPKYQTAGLQSAEDGYQIISLSANHVGDDQVALVLDAAAPLSGVWIRILQPMLDLGRVVPYTLGQKKYYIWLFNKTSMPIRVLDIPRQKGVIKGRELMGIARAIRSLPECHWGHSLYLPSENLCLVMDDVPENAADRRKLATLLLTGGVGDPNMGFDQIRLYNNWLTLADIQEFMQTMGVLEQRSGEHDLKSLGAFKLEGRPELEDFFNEYVVDYYRNRSSYEGLEILPPNGVLLYGPPGTGKTYAAKQLAQFLGWPVREINLGNVGSPYIHQTGLRLRQEFELAAQEAPSIIIMDELDAMGSNRNIMDHHHQVEEISELLRLLETSAQKNVLVIGSTNRVESVDPALLRRGRFDYQLAVHYATVDEIMAVLKKELGKRRIDPRLDLRPYAEQLQERPLSDVAWLVNEAGRLAVRHKRKEIDDWCLDQAMKRMAQSFK